MIVVSTYARKGNLAEILFSVFGSGSGRRVGDPVTITCCDAHYGQDDKPIVLALLALWTGIHRRDSEAKRGRRTEMLV
ncbi:hypothetical protein PoB_002198200 [Plakobranchus ocellatus]|uniref:Uncharacterized protein n=1 Tax=Plakobranchus ocellatus TaxID=259542 RepID=A0AAV3ZJJ0_9GAST|nr:hypothetical protein PoB_002198200 [Plakobranchus ocellatus]